MISLMVHFMKFQSRNQPILQVTELVQRAELVFKLAMHCYQKFEWHFIYHVYNSDLTWFYATRVSLVALYCKTQNIFLAFLIIRFTLVATDVINGFPVVATNVWFVESNAVICIFFVRGCPKQRSDVCTLD